MSAASKILEVMEVVTWRNVANLDLSIVVSCIEYPQWVIMLE